MSAIAERLKAWGHIVTGSDLHESEITNRLNDDGIKVVIGHDIELVKNADLIIYNAAIPDTDPEMIVAKEKSNTEYQHCSAKIYLCTLNNLLHIFLATEEFQRNRNNNQQRCTRNHIQQACTAKICS